MSYFIDNAITDAGQLLLQKGLLGHPIVFTKIVLGDGILGANQIAETMTDVISPKATSRVSKLKLNNRTSFVGATFTFQELTESFYYREVGVYAVDQGVGEILFWYGNAANFGEFIPAPDGNYLKERLIEVGITTGNCENITAIIDSSMTPTYEDLNLKADKTTVNDLSQKVVGLEKYTPHVSIVNIWPVSPNGIFAPDIVDRNTTATPKRVPNSDIVIANPFGNRNRKVEILMSLTGFNEDSGGGHNHSVMTVTMARTHDDYFAEGYTLAHIGGEQIDTKVNTKLYGSVSMAQTVVATGDIPVSIWHWKWYNNTIASNVSGCSYMIIQTLV